MNMKGKSLSREALEIIAARFRALSDASRLQILQCLFAGERSVQELCQQTAMNQANVSKHLAVLLEQGIVGRRRQGSFIHYSISDTSIFQLCELVCTAAGNRFASAAEALQTADNSSKN